MEIRIILLKIAVRSLLNKIFPKKYTDLEKANWEYVDTSTVFGRNGRRNPDGSIKSMRQRREEKKQKRIREGRPYPRDLI